MTKGPKAKKRLSGLSKANTETMTWLFKTNPFKWQTIGSAFQYPSRQGDAFKSQNKQVSSFSSKVFRLLVPGFPDLVCPSHEKICLALLIYHHRSPRHHILVDFYNQLNTDSISAGKTRDCNEGSRIAMKRRWSWTTSATYLYNDCGQTFEHIRHRKHGRSSVLSLLDRSEILSSIVGTCCLTYP